MTIFDNSTPYIFAALLLAFTTVTLGLTLLLLELPNGDVLLRYRRSRRLLALSYLIFGVFGTTKIFDFFASEDIHRTETITLIVSSYQALLFTFSLITLIQPRYVTVRKVVAQLVIITLFASALLLLQVILPHSQYRYVYSLASGVYLGQLLVYTILFGRKYNRFKREVSDYYDEESDNRLSWVRTSFCFSVSVGIAALVFSYFPVSLRHYFVLGFIVFYVWFAINYINFPLRFGYVIAALSEPTNTNFPTTSTVSPYRGSDEEALSQRELSLKIALNNWMEGKQYLRDDVSRDDIAASLGTDRDFLSDYFKKRMKTEFRVWRTKLRIEEAKSVLLNQPELSVSAVAQRVGISDRSNFQKKFSELVGMSPKDWRRLNAAQPDIELRTE